MLATVLGPGGTAQSREQPGCGRCELRQALTLMWVQSEDGLSPQNCDEGAGWGV